MKKRRKQFKTNTASRNALMDGPGKKRFGKKQKKKLLIIAILLLIVCLGATYAVNRHKAKQREAELKARQGEIITRDADKIEVDEEGNPIVKHKDAEIHIIKCGNGNATLIKKGNYEVLVDVGDDITKYLEKNVSGDLEYLILTNHFEGCTKGAAAVYEKFNVVKTLYANPDDAVNELIKNKDAEEINSQIIDMGENLIVSVQKGVGGDYDTDKTAIVKINDNDNRMIIAGQSSEANLATQVDENVFAYIVGGKPTIESFPIRLLNRMSPEYIIASTKETIGADILDICNKTSGTLYTTNIEKDIVFKITADTTESSINYEDSVENLLRIEEEKKAEEEEKAAEEAKEKEEKESEEEE